MEEVLRKVAEESLELFTTVELAALDWLNESQSQNPSNTVINTSIHTKQKVRESLEEIDSSLRSGYRALVSEPSLARVDVLNSEGEEVTYYVCRHSPPTGLGITSKIASRNAPAGRLASLEPGDEYEFPNGVKVEITYITHFYPSKAEREWDSKRNRFVSLDEGPLTIESLRALLNLSAPAVQIKTGQAQ